MQTLQQTSGRTCTAEYCRAVQPRACKRARPQATIVTRPVPLGLRLARAQAVASPQAPPAQPTVLGPAESHETDVVVIGAGIGGLSCAALLAKYGLQVTVLESHSILGGAAHVRTLHLYLRNEQCISSAAAPLAGLSSWRYICAAAQMGSVYARLTELHLLSSMCASRVILSDTRTPALLPNPHWLHWESSARVLSERGGDVFSTLQAWVRDGYHFESGPSLYSGMASSGKDGNPLAHVLQVRAAVSLLASSLAKCCSVVEQHGSKSRHGSPLAHMLLLLRSP